MRKKKIFLLSNYFPRFGVAKNNRREIPKTGKPFLGLNEMEAYIDLKLVPGFRASLYLCKQY